MNATRRALFSFLWLISTSAGAAPIWHSDEVGGPGMVTPLPLSTHAAERDAEAIMRRLRAVIEEHKRQGPPPVGCMEG